MIERSSFDKLVTAILRNNDSMTLSNIPLASIPKTTEWYKTLTWLKQYRKDFRCLPSWDIAASKGIQNVDDGGNAPAWLDLFVRELMLQFTREGMAKLAKLHKEANSSNQMASAINSTMRQISSLAVGRPTRNLTDGFNAVIERLETPDHSPRVTFGWDIMDNNVAGGAEAGDLITFAARFGQGKSWLMCHMAKEALAANHRVLFVSLEMTEEQIFERLLAMYAEMNPMNFKLRQVGTWGLDKLRNVVKELYQSDDFHVVGSDGNLNVEQVRAHIEKYGPNSVYIDAAYKMQMSGFFKAEHERLSALDWETKCMALEYKLPIFKTVQLNREAAKALRSDSKKEEGKREGAGADMVSGSDAIGQNATVLAFIEPGEKNYEKTSRYINVVKARDGGEFRFPINFSIFPCNFKERQDPFTQAAGDDSNWE